MKGVGLTLFLLKYYKYHIISFLIYVKKIGFFADIQINFFLKCIYTFIPIKITQGIIFLLFF